MALIKCSECGAEISEKAAECPKCGCPLTVTMQLISESKKKKRNKIIILVILLLVIIILVSAGIFTVRYMNNPGNRAIRIIEKDFGKDIEVESIYYNSKKNGCIVKFSADGEENTATVHLDDKKAGYQSVMDEYTQESDNAATDEEKQKCAKKIVDYTKIYDIFWEYNLLTNGSKKSGWEKIK